MSELRATALIDNLADGGLLCEWGLAVHIEYRGKSYLLDTGATGKFADNAALLGIGRIVTGHCTGDKAFGLLKRELGEKAEKIHSGFLFEV